MKTLKQISLFFFAGLLAFTSCDTLETEEKKESQDATGFVYVLNYGTWGGTKSTISRYNELGDTMSQNSYATANAGTELNSNIQFGYQVANRLFLIGNTLDQIIEVDAKTLVKSRNGVTDSIANPRYCVAHGDYLYISCWGTSLDYKLMANSYIAKFNLKTNKVDKKIAVAGGPEGLAIVGTKLYIALNYAKKIAVLDLATETVKSISTPAVSSYFAVDKKNNLFVTFVSTPSNFTPNAGIGYLNTATQKIDTVYALSGISSNYGSIFGLNKEKTKLYVVAASYNANWETVGGVEIFDTEKKAFDSQPLLTDVVGINGLSVDPFNNKVYCFVAQSATTPGEVRIFNADGDSLTTKPTGISPQMALFVKE